MKATTVRGFSSHISGEAWDDAKLLPWPKCARNFLGKPSTERDPLVSKAAMRGKGQRKVLLMSST